MMRYLTYIFFFSFLVLIGSPCKLQAKTVTDNYVRTASIYLQGGSALDDRIYELSQFDLIVIPVEAQVWNKSFFTTIRTLNPNIIILPYITTVSWNDASWTDSLHQNMYSHIQPEWWLKDVDGKQVSIWANTRALNLNSDWTQYLTQYVNDSVLSSGYWDGVYFDEVQDSISWVGSVDVNRDGIADTVSQADTLWAENYRKLFEMTRNVIGNNYIIMTNGSSNPDFFPYVNGRMFETFPSSHNTISDWENLTREYITIEQGAAYDSMNMINVNTDNTNGEGSQDDYQAVRFGLTTTLLGDGYFSYDESTFNHATLWTYDEFGAYLGAPKSSRQNIYNPQQTSLSQGVWLREFEKGQAIVNATSSPVTIKLGGEFEKIRGTQDTKTNDGSIVTQIKLEAKDGLILFRPIEKITGNVFLNGAFAKIFNTDGANFRNGFFSYDENYNGGNQIIQSDLNFDGTLETIVATTGEVLIYDDNNILQYSFYPYDDKFRGGINIAVGDLENDGSIEIVTGTDNGGGAHVRIFNSEGVLINPGFFAYDDVYRGGVNVAIGDLNGDGWSEIICGAGVGGGPHVRIFNKNGTLINPGFFAYDPDFRGGVNVASIDTNNDGIDEILTGQGYGGNPEIKLFDNDGNELIKSFLAFDTYGNGVKVSSADLDGDGLDEIIAFTQNVFTLSSF